MTTFDEFLSQAVNDSINADYVTLEQLPPTTIAEWVERLTWYVNNGSTMTLNNPQTRQLRDLLVKAGGLLLAGVYEDEAMSAEAWELNGPPDGEGEDEAYVEDALRRPGAPTGIGTIYD